MVDAKLIAVALTIGMIVAIAINYVKEEKTATSVDYTDDWNKRLDFICSSVHDDGSCFVGLCKAYYNEEIDSTTELLIQCGDGTFRSDTLENLHSTDDWYERSRGEGGNTQAPLHATEEYCDSTSGATFNAAAFQFTGLESESDSNGADSCAGAVPIIAAAVDAEYSRYVSRSHIAQFQTGFNIFCGINNETMAGCEEAAQGFRDGDRDFTATCEDDSLARFSFHQTVLALDQMKHAEATDAEVEAFIRGHCGNVEEGEARRLGLRKFHSGEVHAGLEEEIAKLEEFPEMGSKVRGLREMLNKEKLEPRDAGDVERGRALWGHGHRPHGHSPHGHSPHQHGTGDAHDCRGCGNTCGNNCYGRCGPGCSRWNSCGYSGAGAHRACVEHDYECSCQSTVAAACLMLMIDGLTSTLRDVAGSGNCELSQGANDNCGAASSAPGGSMATTKRVNMAVRTWGERYHSGWSNYGGGSGFTDGNRNSLTHACTKVSMCRSRGGYDGGPTWAGYHYVRNDCNDPWSASYRGDGYGTFVGVVQTIAVVAAVLFGF